MYGRPVLADDAVQTTDGAGAVQSADGQRKLNLRSTSIEAAQLRHQATLSGGDCCRCSCCCWPGRQVD